MNSAAVPAEMLLHLVSLDARILYLGIQIRNLRGGLWNTSDPAPALQSALAEVQAVGLIEYVEATPTSAGGWLSVESMSGSN